MKKLYQKTRVVESLFNYFKPYINLLTKPSGQKLFLLILAMISIQFISSIQFLYKWFISDICKLSLNSYYYLLTYTQIPLEKFALITVKIALSLIPESLRQMPILLIIDDTLQEKFGTHFECYKKFFDHASRNNSNYLNGHCFVALTICIPVIISNEIQYLHIPVRFRLRREKENKLVIASEMINNAMKMLENASKVILLCDSWYPKGEVLATVSKYLNLELIANTRIDTVIRDINPPKRTGKRGRPAEKGKLLSIFTDFEFKKVGDYYIATKMVLTNLFDFPVYLTITTPNLGNHKSYRVFVSTLTPENILKQFVGYEKILQIQTEPLSLEIWTLPLYFYTFRWKIETMFYEVKKFWSFGLYMLRSKQGIENYINIVSICYACMQMLPRTNDIFSNLAESSVQERKYALGESIRRELFLGFSSPESETAINSSDFWTTFDNTFSSKEAS